MSMLDRPVLSRHVGRRHDEPAGLGPRSGCLPRRCLAWLVFAVWPDWLNAILISKKAFVSAILNGVTLAGLYFLVASGFTLVFGLMRNVNLAHGSLYLLGAYIGYEVANRTGYWLLGVAAGFVVLALVGVVMQVFVFRRLEGDDLRQTLVTIGISIVAADLMLAVWAGDDLSDRHAGMARRRGDAADRHGGEVQRRRGLPHAIRSTGSSCSRRRSSSASASG